MGYRTCSEISAVNRDDGGGEGNIFLWKKEDFAIFGKNKRQTKSTTDEKLWSGYHLGLGRLLERPPEWD